MNAVISENDDIKNPLSGIMVHYMKSPLINPIERTPW